MNFWKPYDYAACEEKKYKPVYFKVAFDLTNSLVISKQEKNFSTTGDWT